MEVIEDLRQNRDFCRCENVGHIFWPQYLLKSPKSYILQA